MEVAPAPRKVGKSGFKVIIAGGSIGGMTLAHALAQAGIDHVVLEGRNDIAPQVGASIVLLPNGLRVMDQLGMYEDLEEAMEPLQTAYGWTDKGDLVGRTYGPELAIQRMGYPCAFLSRQRTLQILYDHIEDKSTVHLSKRVERVDTHKDYVTVKCTDGTEYVGDIVVGADGVHSTVREEMRRIADEAGKSDLVAKDRKNMSATYSCVFGISLGVNAAELGEESGIGHRSHGKDCSTLCFVGKNDRIFWFFFKKMDKTYYTPNIPRFARSDIDTHLQPHKDMHITKNLTVGMLWDKISSVSFVPLEESVFDTWVYDRIACVGDSIHKMTPNMGQGGNSAIESATVLANNLKRMLENHDKPDPETVKKALTNYQETRQYRTHLITNVANELTRMEACATWPHKVLALYIYPWLGDFIADLTGDTVIGSEKLEFLPPPPRSLSGHMPFDRNSGIGHKENRLIRLLFALPLLAFCYFASHTMGAAINGMFPYLTEAVKSLSFNYGIGSSIPMIKNFTGLASIDNTLRAYIAFFMPALAGIDPMARLQAIAFGADLVPLQTVWALESIRRGNLLTVVALFPLVFGIAYQLKGLAFVAPVFYFFHYMQTPMENYAPIDNRLCNMNYVKTLLPALVLGYVVPSVAMFAPALSIGTRQYINGAWQFFPVIFAVLHWIFSLCVTDTTRHDRLYKPEADLPYLKPIYAFAFAVSSLTYLSLWAFSPYSMTDIFFSGLANPGMVKNIVQGAAAALRWDQIVTFSATFLWILLGFNDMKAAGRTDASWFKIGGVLAGTSLVCGPGAGMCAMWAWRENILRRKLTPKD